MKKGLILCLTIMVAVIMTGCSKTTKNTLSEITLDDYLEIIENKETKVVYIDSNDDMSANYKKSLKKTLSDLDKKVYYLDTTKFASKDAKVLKFMNASSKTKDGYTVPMIVYIKNGKIADSTIGYIDDLTIKTFIKKYVK
jgi:hypothetical protein